MEISELYVENPILMLSTVRVHAERGESVDEEEIKLLKKYCRYLSLAKKSEILNELNLMLMADSGDEAFRVLFNAGILKIIFPQLDKCFYEPQKNKYHIYNVGEHILHAVKGAPPILSVKWAALMHDIGKPECPSIDPSGTIHFYGHHTESVRIAKDFCYKYAFDSELRKEICTLVEYHDVHFETTEKGVKRALARLGEVMFLRLLDLQEADASAKSAQYINDKARKLTKLRETCTRVIASGEPYRYSDLAIGKRDLVKLKYKAEHRMRDVLRILFDEVIENPTLNNRDYLLKRAKELK